MKNCLKASECTFLHIRKAFVRAWHMRSVMKMYMMRIVVPEKLLMTVVTIINEYGVIT